MAETSDKRILSKETDYSGKPIVVYSTTGQPKTEAEFVQALDTYNSNQGIGEIPGFTILPQGSAQDTARSAFETVNQPIQRGATAISESINPPKEVAGLGDAARGTAWLATQLPKVAASTVATPERALESAASVAAAYKTKGMSVLSKMIGAGVAGGTGNIAGQTAFGSSAQKSTGKVLIEAATSAGMAVAAEGAVGAFKSAIGHSISQKAQSGVAKEMSDYIKKEFSTFANDPQALNVILSTPGGLAKVSKLGLKGIRGDADDLAADLTTNLVKGTKSGIAIESIEPLNKHVKDLVKLQNRLLDHYDDTDAIVNPIKNDINASVKEIVNILVSSTKSNATPLKDKILLSEMIKDVQERVDKIGAGAALFRSLKASGTDHGFDVRRFQYEMKMLSTSDRMTDDAALIAGRGEYGGIDKQHSIPLKLKSIGIDLPWGLSNAGVDLSLGKSYAGKVPGTAPFANAVAQRTILGIKDYVEQGNYKSKDQRR